VYSILPTPFLARGPIDEDSLRRVVDLFVAAGVDGVTALGVTSETVRLSDPERRRTVEIVVDQVAGRVATVVGATADGLAPCVANAREAKALGATALMVSPPRMAKLNSEAVVQHYRGVAEAVDLPIIVQDFPPMSGYTMEAGLLARVAGEVPTARTIKLEDPPTPHKTGRILAECRDVPVEILGGLGGVFLLEDLMAGAVGVMTGFAYPEVLVAVVRRYQSGDVDGAADVFYRCAPLLRFEFQEGIGMAIRKEILRRRGALADGSTRAPGPVLDAATAAQLDRVLAWTAQWKEAPWISA
jgi:4-hydroxy-tetrahydrodipicolinate synthase